jgi:Cu-Zn family superoxide dismutase
MVSFFGLVLLAGCCPATPREDTTPAAAATPGEAGAPVPEGDTTGQPAGAPAAADPPPAPPPAAGAQGEAAPAPPAPAPPPAAAPPAAGAQGGAQRRAAAQLQRVRGKAGAAGEASFEQDGTQVVLRISARGLPPGAHGVAIHEKGDCSDRGRKVGRHLDPTGVAHGPRESGTRHAGDFGNLEVAADGTGTLEIRTDSITLEEGPAGVVGRALTISESGDDGKSQPAGGAGKPLLCGVIAAQ